MALKCTNTSGPFSWVMNPYPLSGLNHFTVPVATSNTLLSCPDPSLSAAREGDRLSPAEGTARSQELDAEPSRPLYAAAAAATAAATRGSRGACGPATGGGAWP